MERMGKGLAYCVILAFWAFSYEVNGQSISPVSPVLLQAEVNFSEFGKRVVEEDSLIEMKIRLTTNAINGIPQQLDVAYEVACESTAESPTDYQIFSGQFTFHAGALNGSIASIRVQIKEDVEMEGMEVFDVRLAKTNRRWGVLGNFIDARFIIQDDDGKLIGAPRGNVSYSDTLVAINPKSGEIYRRSGWGMLGFKQLNSLAYDNKNDIYYSVSYTDELVRINKKTGNALPVGFHGMRQILGIAYDDVHDVLYGVEYAANGRLVVLDRKSGKATEVGSTGYNQLVTLFYNHNDGFLYGLDHQTRYLVKIDPASGNGINQVYIASAGAYYSMAYNPSDGLCYINPGNYLSSLDPITGVITNLGYFNNYFVNFIGMAFGHAGELSVLNSITWEFSQVDISAVQLVNPKQYYVNWGKGTYDDASDILYILFSTGASLLGKWVGVVHADTGLILKAWKTPYDLRTIELVGNGKLLVFGNYTHLFSYEINRYTGEYVQHTTLETFMWDVTYDPVNDLLYGSQGDFLYILNPNTGDATLVADMQYSIDNIEYLPSIDKLYGVSASDSGLWQINKATGQQTIAMNMPKSFEMFVNYKNDSLAGIARSSGQDFTFMIVDVGASSLHSMNSLGHFKIESLAWDKNNDRFFAMSIEGLQRDLFTVDERYESRSIRYYYGTTQSLILAYNANLDDLYAIRVIGYEDILWSINTQTWVETPLGYLFNGTCDDFVYADSLDTYYAVSNETHELCTVNVNTLQQTAIGSVGTNSIKALTYYPDWGGLIAIDYTDSNLYLIDITTAQKTLVSNLPAKKFEALGFQE